MFSHKKMNNCTDNVILSNDETSAIELLSSKNLPNPIHLNFLSYQYLPSFRINNLWHLKHSYFTCIHQIQPLFWRLWKSVNTHYHKKTFFKYQQKRKWEEKIFLLLLSSEQCAGIDMAVIAAMDHMVGGNWS